MTASRNRPYLEPTQAAGAALFSRGTGDLAGAVVMLNLLQLRETADYSATPALRPVQPISGREALQRYIEHTLPFLHASGGELVLLGEGGKFFIGPADEQWDVVMLVRQSSLAGFLSFSQNREYLAGIGHRTAAIRDSRLLPIAEFPDKKISTG